MNVKKIKTTNQFMEQALILMEKLGKTYCSININKSCHKVNNSYKEEYSVYIDGYDHIKGITPEEALENWRLKQV